MNTSRTIALLLMAGLLSCLGLCASTAAHGGEPELLPADRSIAEAINHYVARRCADEGVTAAGRADDTALLRRTLLDLVGRPATAEESRRHLAAALPATEKQRQLVDRLLASPEFPDHLADQFDALLMAGSGKSLREYLAAAIGANRGWDLMFQDMMVARDALAKEKQADQFVLSRVKDLDRLTNQASVAFFGVNVSCAKCHDHPEVGDWTQGRFYGMKSFFYRTFENGGFLGERDHGFVSYKTTSGEGREAQLMFLSGTVVPEPPQPNPSEAELKAAKQQLEQLKKKKQPPPPPAYSRRSQLVDVALRAGERQYFARAIVNKLWYQFLGRGLVMPIDQMHPENPPSHPQLMEWLARDLIAHNYDLRRLIRGIVLSDVYARQSRWSGDGDGPDPSLFAVARVRALSPRQYAMVLTLASRNPDQFAADVPEDTLSERLTTVFKRSRGLAGLFEQPRENFQISVDEALLLNNSDRIQRELLGDDKQSLLGKLKTLESPPQRVETAVWSVFGRAPTDIERTAIEAFLATRDERPGEANRQMIWALLASGHCRFNH